MPAALRLASSCAFLLALLPAAVAQHAPGRTAAPRSDRFSRAFRAAPAHFTPPLGTSPFGQPAGSVPRAGADFGVPPHAGGGVGGAGSPGSEAGDAARSPRGRGAHDGLRYPIEIPIHASLYGITPGNYTTWYVPRSSASVTIRTGSGVTVHASRTPYVDTITAALDRLLHNERAAAHVKDGVARFQGRDYAGALEHFRRAVPLDPDNALPRFAVTLAQFALGEYEGAAYALRRGLDLLPDWSRSGLDLAGWYSQGEDLEDQLQALRSYCRLRPDDLEARVLQGYVELFSGDLERAAAAFEAVRDARPDDPLPAHFLDEIATVRARREE